MRVPLTAGIAACAGLLLPPGAQAYISQVDGTPLPDASETASCEGSSKPRLQCCLDGSYGEVVNGAVDATAEARIQPEAYRPVEDPPGSMNYPVTFRMIGEGAGFRNLFGWYWTDEDPTDSANLHPVFDCRPTSSSCSCPCDPTTIRDTDGSATSWERTIDFTTLPGFMPGRAIGFWIRTEEELDGDRNDEHCGVALTDAQSEDHRTYYTSKALNDDGDYVHFLVYRSVEIDDTFYFAFEDLFRGGDNDFEDVLVQVEGLVPLCEPRLETCDGVDNDCDLNVDEGLTQGCSTACGSGIRQCTGGEFGDCSAPEPVAETCNGLDDNCNGTVDEGLMRPCSNMCGSGDEVCVAGAWADCNAPTPEIEDCDGFDDDCDGTVDEDITRACSTMCGSGVEACVDGSFVGCTAPVPGTEVCNGTDDDCDGLTDESITRSCSTDCGSGIETCVSGSFVGCTAPRPGLEVCNGTDDDCDGDVDEDLTRTCSSACGTGTEHCDNGSWVGCDAPASEPEVCNNEDDDCNGIIDDGNPGGGDGCFPDGDGGFIVVDPEAPLGELCVPGGVECVAGELVCVGASSPTREICNCEDDDCDGLVDEGAGDSICPGGSCHDCTCVSPCANEEFPCPPGRTCDTSLGDPTRGLLGYCVAGMCAGVDCADTEVCDPGTGECVDLCADVSCPEGRACVRGSCVEDNCYGRGCPPGERCRGASCEPDPCLGMTCGEREFCRDGECVAVCDVSCPDGKQCRDGACVDVPCGGECGGDETCVDGECLPDFCDPPCGRDRVCRGEACIDDPCNGIRCPEGTSCGDGQCVDDSLPPPVRDADLGLATGRGGCTCSAPGGSRPGLPGLWLALGLLGALVLRRRLPRARLRMAALCALAWAASSLLAGCEPDPFCFAHCGDGGDGGDGRVGGDAGPPEAGPVDGCVAQGAETCNGVDDDCNGFVDDGYDLESDPRHCGECDQECVLPHAFPACEGGECAVARCEIGFHDLNGNPTDGCEYACLPSGNEICDGRDNDCDNAVDEGIDVATELGNCGECGRVCAFANAEAACEGGTCVMGDCNAGFSNTNGQPSDGCELRCTPLGPEECNSIDDDCDGRVDEGFDLASDPLHCGACNRPCAFPHATGACEDGVCQIGTCEDGFIDVDGDPRTGCEIECTSTAADDPCDGSDNDCDGVVDEDAAGAGGACGSAVGVCERGTLTCQGGDLVCVGGAGPTPETCNGVDDDCNGTVDEGAAGTGGRCGETNVGACEYGVVVCTAGALACGGSYVGPTAELCNGIDDDCDGSVDDSPAPPASTPASCGNTTGVCGNRGPECTGAGGWQCSDPDGYQSIESLCDGLDNDCDDATDEGCLVAAPSFDRRVDRGDGSGEHNSVQAVVSGDGFDTVYAGWMDLRPGGRAHVLFNRSINGGDTWGASPFRVDEASGAAIGPRIAVTGSVRDHVALLWSDFRGGSSYRETFVRDSTDRGASWPVGDRRINQGQNEDSFNVDLAVSGSRVYAVWETFTAPRSRHVFFARSLDGGSSWGSYFQVDGGAGSTFVASTPKVAASGDHVYVVWRDNRNGALDIYFNRSTDRGLTFQPGDTRLDTGTSPGSSASFAPAIAAEGANVYVVWVDDRSGSSFDIWMNRSQNRGAAWRPDALLLDDDPLPHDSVEPRVVAPAPGVALAAWTDFRFGFSDVLVARSTDAGDDWSSPGRVDTGTEPGTSGSFDVALGGAGDLVVVAWADDRDGFLDIYTNYSIDGGTLFQPNDVRLDTTFLPGSSDSELPAVYVTPDAAHVVWVDHRSGANGDIYYRRLE